MSHEWQVYRRSFWCTLGLHRWHYYDNGLRKYGFSRRCTRWGCTKDEVLHG